MWTIGTVILLLMGVYWFNTQRRDEVLVRDPGHRLYSAPMQIAAEATKEWEYAVLAENVYVGQWGDDVNAPAQSGPTTPNAFRAVCDETAPSAHAVGWMAPMERLSQRSPG